LGFFRGYALARQKTEAGAENWGAFEGSLTGFRRMGYSEVTCYMLHSEVIDACCNRRRGVVQFGDGLTLTVRANGSWSLWRGVEDAVLALCDGVRGNWKTGAARIASGTADSSSIYLTLEQQEARCFLVREIASMRAEPRDPRLDVSYEVAS
jgi:hypothetical protein